MKKLYCLLLLLTACSGSNRYGQCVGINDDKDPKLQYKYSIKNIVVGIFFIEMIEMIQHILNNIYPPFYPECH